MGNPLLLSFVGPAGSGKTTASNIAMKILSREGIVAAKLDVAEPLRKIQSFAYNEFGRPNPGSPEHAETFLQDGKLLGFLAEHFGNYLQNSFKKRFNCLAEDLARGTWLSDAEIQTAIINADCRNNCYPTLEELDFTFIRLQVSDETRAKRLQRRSDISEGVSSIDATNLISESIIINNDGSLSELKAKIEGAIIGNLTN